MEEFLAFDTLVLAPMILAMLGSITRERLSLSPVEPAPFQLHFRSNPANLFTSEKLLGNVSFGSSQAQERQMEKVEGI